MKLLIVLATLSFAIVPAFAQETSTECVMMKEQNDRINPKQNLAEVKAKSQAGKTKSSKQ
jgi:hypothetical protein